MAKRVVIPGGSGFLGGHLREQLVNRGDEVVVLTRGQARSDDGWRTVHWDGESQGDWIAELAVADVIVHMSGKRVDCRPTKANIAELTSSRAGPVRLVGDALREVDSPPPIWIQLSTLARFGDSGDEVIDESTPPPVDGLPQMVGVAKQWEEAFAEASAGMARTVLLRPSIAIGGKGDPATERLVWLARMGLGGKIASGKQWVSWVALEDLIRVILMAIDDDQMTGLYHVTAPHPVTNAEMMETYRRLVGRRFGLPSPRALTTVGAWLLGSDPALALSGRRGVPTRLLGEGFEFRVENFEDAVRTALERLNLNDHRHRT